MPKSDQDKDMREAMAPLCLELGQALYICQCFEDSLCFLLSLVSHEKANGEDDAFRAAWDFHSKKTVSNLLKLLRERIDVPSELDGYFGVGVEKRNEIVHGFLTKNQNVQRWMTPKGRLEVEEELTMLKLEVKRRDIVVNKWLDALLEKYGISNQMLKDNAGKLWDLLNPDARSASSSSTH